MRLYRGVDLIQSELDEYQLIAKGADSTWEWKADSTHVTADNAEVTVDKSNINAVYAHQHHHIGFDKSAWISCSLDPEVAKHFATIGGMVEGIVYVLESDDFEKHGVELKALLESAPESHEKEISIRSKNGGSISNEVIVHKYSVG